MRFKFKCLVTFLATVWLLSAPVGAADLRDIRVGVTSATKTRIVFDVSAKPEFVIYGDRQGQGRMSVVFENLAVKPKGQWLARPRGHVGTIGMAPNTQRTFEVSFRKPAKVDKIFLIEPNQTSKTYRLVIDVSNGTIAEFLASLPSEKKPKSDDRLADIIQSVTVTRPAQEVSRPVAATQTQAVVFNTEKPVIVIDAGHGGSDPGAIGASGTKESVVNLAAAKKLKEILDSTGKFIVVMTRDSDQRIAHEERSRKAQKAEAQLFISLHADAHNDKNLRGGSVYTLSAEGEERSAREARESGNFVVLNEDASVAGEEVGGILFDLVQRDTVNNSSQFAEILVGNLGGVTPLLNNTHRTGNLKVLLAPDVPAVLLELAFISNAKDEANLKSERWRKKTMHAVATAIEVYFEDRDKARLTAVSGNSQSGGE